MSLELSLTAQLLLVLRHGSLQFRWWQLDPIIVHYFRYLYRQAPLSPRLEITDLQLSRSQHWLD